MFCFVYFFYGKCSFFFYYYYIRESVILQCNFLGYYVVVVFYLDFLNLEK